jgi:hypothetical protein
LGVVAWRLSRVTGNNAAKVYPMDRLCGHTAPYPNEFSTVPQPKIHPGLTFLLPYLVPYLAPNYYKKNHEVGAL